MSKLRYILSTPFILIACCVLWVYAVIGGIACLIGGKRTANTMVELTESLMK
jgi:hypothetical protein